MRYLGGKSKLGKQIASAILAHTDRRGDYYEPFLGGGNTFEHLAPRFARLFASDVHEDLMLMWQAAGDGWKPPVSLSEEEYLRLRKEPPSALRGFAGFGSSFGGKWWGGYARFKGPWKIDFDYVGATARCIERLAPTMHRACLRRCSYDEWSPAPGSVVYADPPYEGTTEYKNNVPFDHHRFWEIMREWSQRGVDVFVSEYRAPDGWRAIWSKDRPCRLKNMETRDREQLFVLDR